MALQLATYLNSQSDKRFLGDIEAYPGLSNLINQRLGWSEATVCSLISRLSHLVAHGKTVMSSKQFVKNLRNKYEGEANEDGIMASQEAVIVNNNNHTNESQLTKNASKTGAF